jgi:hypothetical protein
LHRKERNEEKEKREGVLVGHKQSGNERESNLAGEKGRKKLKGDPESEGGGGVRDL